MRDNTKLYLTFAALIVLLIATVGFSFLSLGSASLWIALGISTAKTLLIAIVFMKLSESFSVIRLAAGTGLLWLSILVAITVADYRTRGWKETPDRDAHNIQRFDTFDKVEPRERDAT